MNIELGFNPDNQPHRLSLPERDQLGSFYCDSEERFVVSYITTWGTPERPDVVTPEGAVKAALDYITTDVNRRDTLWCVYDRHTGKTLYIEQSQVDDGSEF